LTDLFLIMIIVTESGDLSSYSGVLSNLTRNVDSKCLTSVSDTQQQDVITLDDRGKIAGLWCTHQVALYEVNRGQSVRPHDYMTCNVICLTIAMGILSVRMLYGSTLHEKGARSLYLFIYAV